MRADTPNADAAPPTGLTPRRPTEPRIPDGRAERDRLLDAVRAYVAGADCTPPLSLPELRTHSDVLLRQAGEDGAYRDFTAVLVSNEAWRETYAGVPYRRRLLLLPQCLRDPDHCPGEMDDVGLTCRRCGRCVLAGLLDEAESLGYAALVAEGSPVVISLIQTGQVQAILGVGCLDMLERVFPYMESGAVPGLAIPLLYDGCRATAVDVDWVLDALHTTSDDRARLLDLDALRAHVEKWFTPAALETVLGTPSDETRRIALDYLAAGGKRWRPFLTAALYQALQNDPCAPPPDPLRPAAVAAECFHKASLIHDDIEDGDGARDGRPTLHAAHGVPVALNAGDLLLGEGYRLIAEGPYDAETKSRLLAAAADSHCTLAVGQGAELCWARRPAALSVEDVLAIFRRKTAPAFEAALRFAAACAGADEALTGLLEPYSEALGTAYQIRDDLDDFFGPDAGDGARRLRPSLPLALARERATGSAAEWLDGLVSRGQIEPSERARLREVLARLEVEARMRAMLETHKAAALAAIRPLGNPTVKGLLRRVVAKIFRETPNLECCRDHQAGDARRRVARGR